MPMYDYKCNGCGATFEAFNRIDERHEQRCSCGEQAKIAFSAPAVHGFKCGWFRDIAPDPVYARSKKELKELCKKHDCYAPGVLDG